MRHEARFSSNSRFATILFIAAFAVVTIAAAACGAEEKPANFENLKQRLMQDADKSLPADYIASVFANPELEFASKGISSYFRHRESKLNYGQFLEEDSIEKAAAYMKAHQAQLKRAEEKFGVSAEVITAVMLVETRLGTYTGRQSVINILSTMAALSDKAVRQRFREQLPKKDRISKERFERKADSKSDWAYRELKAFLTYTAREDMDPFKIRGSYAGAVGIAQFMPSNILRLAEDGNADGRVDLFDHEDAIFSIARYLSHYGWKPGISRKKAEKVVHHYNHSSYYVKTILDISDKLKES